LFATVSFFPVSVQAQSLNQRFSDNYVEQARQAMQDGRMDDALFLLDEALLFVPGHADAAYLRAFCGWLEKQGMDTILPYLETALAGERFFYYSRDDAAWLYAYFLIQIGQYASGIRFLDSLYPEPRVLLARIEALRLSARYEEMYRNIHSVLDRYPDQLAGLLPWIHTIDEHERQPADFALVQRMLPLLDHLRDSHPDLVPALLPFIPDLGRQKTLLSAYREAGHSSARSTRLALQLGLIDDFSAADELFSGAYPLFDDQFRLIYSLLGSEAGRAYFASRFAAYTGTVLHDANTDGIAEQTVSYVAGQPESLVLDNNQDGLAEAVLSLRAGKPTHINISWPTRTMRLQYNPWPWVSEALIQDTGASRRYQLPLRSRMVPLLETEKIASGNFGSIELIRLDLFQLPPERSFLQEAVLLEEQTARYNQTVHLYHGLPLQSLYSDINGMVSRAVHDDTGFARVEHVDLNGDGIFNARRVWRIMPDGTALPEYIDVDSTGDGYFEYREALLPPYTRHWDLDKDGRFDLTVSTYDANVQHYEFSSRADGVFDIQVDYVNGIPGRFLRDGVQQSLLPDRNQKVFWISRKLFDFGTAAPAEGWAVHSGKRYYVMKIGDLYFAEILP